MGTIVFLFWLAFAELKIQEFWLTGNPATDCEIGVCIRVPRYSENGV
uniref:Uncharacterized protein n=1 Tax=Myoviridae sp. ctLnO19 TaxID=2825085 RepID=A0A8S5NZH2_9CAUD|nr:MAG TPA: hypothetical protein [Myoviridae sp. ctLnO19]